MKPTARLRAALLEGRGLLAALWRDEEAVSAVEIAFAAPVLALFIIGIIDYGSAATRQAALANAVRAGAQYAVIDPPLDLDYSDVSQRVLDSAPEPKIGTHVPAIRLFCECPANPGVEVACNPGICGASISQFSFLEIRLTEQFPLIFAYPGFDNPITLGESTTVLLGGG